METAQTAAREERRKKVVTALVLCIAGIVLNIGGSLASQAFNLPLYLDSLGTVLAAVLGGYMPGIAVGYLTNLINSATDDSTLYYGVISVLIAVCSAYLAQRGWFKRLHTTLLAIIPLTLIGGGVGSVLTWFLSGSQFGDGISAPLAQQIYATGTLGMFPSQLLADLAVDFVDKALIVLVVALIVHVLSKRQLETLDLKFWMQAPLTDEEMEAARHTKSRGMALRTKIVVLVSLIMAVVAVATTGISYMMYHRSMVESESKTGSGIAELAGKAVDASRVNEYLTEGEKAPGYAEAEQRLAQIRDSFADVQYVYVYKILEDGCHVVFDPDTADETGADPGDVVPFDDAFSLYLPALLQGEEIDPVVSDESYGWLLTVYKPLYDQDGKCACYVAADISMDRVVADESAFLARVIALFAALFILVCAIVLWLAEFSVILPVNSISLASDNFAFDNEGARNESVEQIRKLDVHTGDEVENLYRAVLQMSQDTVGYIADAQEKNATISRMQGNLIMVMADLVESRDKFTGDHVRKTAAYTLIIMEQMRRQGIYADQMTDEFISDVHQSAPLHDVGKIVVSDTILNKPGRLTDEEFKIMQSHTLAGQEIIERAKGAVSESSYLDEAQNLAAYHHEKWDGTGYPYGIAGEEIPLSARIMAVADVFDALVSKRSYKDGFPIEKALAIIEEGIGSHFDPEVAKAFLQVQDEARRIAEENLGEE